MSFDRYDNTHSVTEQFSHEKVYGETNTCTEHCKRYRMNMEDRKDKLSLRMKKLNSIKMKQKNKRKNVKLIDNGKEKLVTGRKHRERRLTKANFEKPKNYIDNDGNLESMNEKSIKIVKRGLKRKHNVNDSMQNSEDKLSSENIIANNAKLREQRKVDSSGQSTDTLNLTDLSKEHILQCISAIFHLTEEQLKNKNALFDGESQPVFMQVTCIRVPKTPRRHMRILLPHSIVGSDDEVVLFVGDLQRGKRQDNDITVDHYEELLRKHGCTNIKRVISFNQVKTEYDQYELKRKLLGSYDHFLVDGKIAGHLSHLLGKEFYKKRKLPTYIRMQSKDLKHEIEYALRKTSIQLHSYGDTHIVQIGHTSMRKEEILENVFELCTHLSKNYPGGWTNIRSIRLKTPKSLALPIYTSLRNKNSVDVPMIQPKRPKAYHNVTGELSTIVDAINVTVTPEGEVVLKKRKRRLKTSNVNQKL
ncbi:ribosomal L1 domain-containing protein 1 [Megalopta genalis]|uniref:ribosomal L1 domain-containing protein 1 n=1 Tax=Megalopta genalis TaxID=115081 RepID=UPI003FD2114C